eukprot:TRINITY_DN1621_c0_g2_i1.p1 TRINITY_DN1621_c0_g2~~TRINITY_DN1621_c0_g2_i1.p1  ORF type:complete len:375 (+),score=160.96 TRINITY_DN1621_c0_g2_i1:38-1162(+)
MTGQESIKTSGGERGAAEGERPPPVEFPSLPEIKKAIPAEYFGGSLALSSYYVVRSAVLLSLCFAAAHFCALQPASPVYIENPLARYAFLVLYWNIQGMLMWGVFTIGHDCGHGSFSNSKLWNQIFGNLTHSFLLVPYESWKITHNWHHKNTGNIDKDEIFYPQRSNTMYDWVRRAIVPFTVGAWYVYLFGTQHFNPYNPTFKGRRKEVTVSLACWAAVALAAYALSLRLGWAYMAALYFVPIGVFATWLVVTTFLHHNDEEAPWYNDDEWSYVKGNLSSVDRSYGVGIDNLIHNIGTHQVHHLFPIIPHYYLVPSTSYFRRAFPRLVRKSDDPLLSAFFKGWYNYMLYGHSVPASQRTFVYAEAARNARPHAS